MGGLSKCAANDSICGVEILPMRVFEHLDCLSCGASKHLGVLARLRPRHRNVLDVWQIFPAQIFPKSPATIVLGYGGSEAAKK